MKLAAIYEKEIKRTINPAITAQDLSEESIQIEIEEYVFTEEIVKNLYNTLLAIKEKKVSKTGIWINGYYGSGKSHFLKYLHYCVNPLTKEKAFDRLVKAVKEDFDPLKNAKVKLNITITDINDLKKWYEKAEIEDVLFNAQDVSKAKKDDTTFTNIFFNMFNRCRGYNAYNIPLAVLFEKYLDDRGKLGEFKARLDEETGFDWDTDAADVVSTELDTILEVARQCVPSLDTAALKTTLLNPQMYYIDTVRFSNEVKEYIEKKDQNYRLLFLVDEVSQFVNANRSLLLDLQSIVERLSDDCKKQVWVACTAQQTVEDVTSATGITSGSDDYGKIMGRFETRVSLESTDPAYITQKRILEKNSDGLRELKELYREKKDAILNQFGATHELYNGFRNEEEFILSYPFIPYQFKLISQVFESFQRLEYVVKEVKDNERSILKITHETAKRTKDWEVGQFIPFDEFYNNMFQQNLIHKGSNAISPALKLRFVAEDKEAERIVKVLFMISNLGDKNQQHFKPTLDNLTLLLMSEVDQNKAPLRDKINQVLDELIRQNIIRQENDEYYFYNEDEAELSTMIKNTTISFDARVGIIKDILFPYIGVESRFRFSGNDFRITASIDGRNYFPTNNVDAQVAFLVFDNNKPEELALSSASNSLSFCLSELLEKEKEFQVQLDWYCKVESYLANHQSASTEARKRSLEEFRSRNKDLFRTKIEGTLHGMLDRCRVVSGQTVLNASDLGGKGKERYKKALEKHFESLYKYAASASSLPLVADDLRRRVDVILTKNYDQMPMSEPEQMVNDYITRFGNEILLSDLIQHFSKVPYGWKDTAVIFLVCELVKRRLREIKYRNQSRVPVKEFMQKALNSTERTALSITSTQDIPQELLNNAIESWAKIFNEHIQSSSDGNALFDNLKAKLEEQTAKWIHLKIEVENYPFARPVTRLTDKLNSWMQIRDLKRFFETLIAEKEITAGEIDTCREIDSFVETQLNEYNKIKKFFRDNAANLNGLDEANRQKAEGMRLFFESEQPYEELRIIKKVHKELEAAITENLHAIRQKTMDAYRNLFDEIESLAKANELDPNMHASRHHYIERIEKERDILQLQLMLSDAEKLKSDQRAMILKEADRIRQAKEAKNKPPTEILVVAEPPVEYSLPKANKVLVTQADVDAYVEEIKNKLLKMIKENKKIIIK